MRIMLDIIIPNEEFNEAVRDGTVGEKMGRILEEANPETVYFSEKAGFRNCVMVVDLANPSMIPAIAEPWFLLFNAEVEFKIVMTPEDLQGAGLEALGKKWGG